MGAVPAKYKMMSTLLAVTCTGCASTQLNYNALDIASTYDQIITKQVTFNLQKTLRDKEGIPAYVKVTAGSVTTQASATPTFSIPFTSSITNLVQNSLAPTGLTKQTSKTSIFAGSGVSLAATDQFNQVYTTVPVTDSDQLRRLRSLYQFVTRQLPVEDFESTYNLIETGNAGSSPTGTKLTVFVEGKAVSVLEDKSSQKDDDGVTYVRRSYMPSIDGIFRGYTWSVVRPDKTFIKQPGCILCDYGHNLSSDEAESVIGKVNSSKKENFKKTIIYRKLEKNTDLRNDWLYLPGEQIASDAIALPSNDFGTLYVRNIVFTNGTPSSGLRYFNELALFSEDASSQGTGSPSSGGQSQGRKTSPLERVSIPVSGGSLPNP